MSNPYLGDPSVGALEPSAQALAGHISANLAKVHAGRNIAGLERDHDYAAGGPVIPARPTPFRFSALLARAKELVQLAAQTEAGLLAALEKRDAEAYTLLKARQDVGLAAERGDRRGAGGGGP